MSAQLLQLLLDRLRKVGLKAALPNNIPCDGLQIEVRWVRRHSVTTAFTRFRGRSTLYPFFVAT